jgi:hypothetical protein
MRKPQLLTDATNKLGGISLPTVVGRTKRQSRVRKPLIVTATLAGLSVLGVAAKALVDGRYATGEAQVVKLVEREDGSVVVLLYGHTFCVPAEMAEVVKTYKEGDRMPYRIDTWRRTSDGLHTGTLGVTSSNPSPTQAEPDQI